MANPRRKIRSEFWIGALFVVIVVYALLIDWWKTHATIGWIILCVLVAGAIYVIYRYARLRGWLGRQIKDGMQKVVFEKVASAREPVPQTERNEVLARARFRCENEQCDYQGKPHIHHIDGNNQHNNLGNLIALCPNCHQKAHDGIFTESQLIVWVRRDYQRLKARRAQR